MIRACLLTASVELAVFLCTEYRRKEDFWLICVLTNALTNLSLNLLAGWILRVRPSASYWTISLLEIPVVWAEYAIYASFYGRSSKLFGITLLANLLTWGIGVLFYVFF